VSVAVGSGPWKDLVLEFLRGSRNEIQHRRGILGGRGEAPVWGVEIYSSTPIYAYCVFI